VRLGVLAHPDPRQRRRGGRTAERGQPVRVLDGEEQGVVVDLPGVRARADVVSDDDRRYWVDRAARVLIEGDNQSAVVVSGPPGVPVEVLLNPAVTGAHRAVVHAVAHVRGYDGTVGNLR
jgi:hypothetical protein